ncbi:MULTISPECIES: ferritin family protein [unclassified Clostridium]|uniref:ferritin family protein n=1 Tax=unclassified Clostridium TaxID=2614128 RepID=UPI000297670B|nr:MULTISPECIES: ferritin family protein [unclassified Clostridium]EKQ57994.1 MAG: hypothetical protein A370_00344 [Clostridium sp. Maddingley MBC34-26]
MNNTSDIQFLGNRNNNDATFLMEGLISEIEAINDYDYSLTLTENEEVRKILSHIRNEEVGHYFSFLEALRKIDNEFNTAAQAIQKQINIQSKINYNEYSCIKENKVLLFTSIRNAIKGELDAIILYNKFLNEVKSNELFKIIKVIDINEKEHVEELTRLLVLLEKENDKQ